MQLSEHDDGSDDQHNGNRKLEYDQGAPEPSGFCTSLQPAFQYLYRFKAGQEESRVASRQQTHCKRQCDQEGQYNRGKEAAQSHCLAGQRIEKRQCQEGDSDAGQ